MELADVCRVRDDGVEIDVSVSPRSNRSGPDGFDEWRRRLVVRVRAPPLDGRANREVADLFSDITGCRSEVTSGQTSRQKTVTVRGDPAEIMSRLGGEIHGRCRAPRVDTASAGRPVVDARHAHNPG